MNRSARRAVAESAELSAVWFGSRTMWRAGSPAPDSGPVLDQEELHSAVATSACANPILSARAGRPDVVPQRRTMETSRVWRCDDRWHTAYAVDRRPELGREATPLPCLVSLLTSVPAYATTFSLTVRRGSRQGDVSVSGHVRITGGSDTELVGVRRALEQAARHARVGLVRLDREQLPGVLTTLPLGGAQFAASVV